MSEQVEREVDVLIVGGGLAGLALARQLLLRSELNILLVDRKALPPSRQKVGEATVQVSGYYYARVLEMEEHLLCEHYMKYNLRFYWKGSAGDGISRYEELDQSYIRGLSNIVTYQLDRNVFEAALLAACCASPRFELHAPAADLAVELQEESAERPAAAGGEAGPHHFRFRSGDQQVAGRAAWVVDASGRGRFLARRQGLDAESPIQHGSTFCWVDGLVDIEKLTDLDAPGVRKRRDRARLGHVPAMLATNHFCGEGYWFWTIPLHGKTSLGLVYDRNLVPRQDVATAEKMIDWVCRQYPLFARDLPQRQIVEWSGFTDFALDSTRTISAARWAMCGEACRFSDPLYSPGGDLISIYNTLITDAILTADPRQLASKVRMYEELARAVYEAYVPSFAVSYEVLGDQETFTLRYVWELAVYFSFFVFPFINDLFTDRQFVPFFLRNFARLGPTNRNLHGFLVGFYRWKKADAASAAAGVGAGGSGDAGSVGAAGGFGEAGSAAAAPRHFDFYEFEHLRAAEACFYRVGLTAEEARPVLTEQLENLEDLARFAVAHISSVVTGDRRALSAAFVAGIDLRRLVFDPAAMQERLAEIGAVGAVGAPPAPGANGAPDANGASGAEGAGGEPAPYSWRCKPASMERFRRMVSRAPQEEAAANPAAAAAPGAEEVLESVEVGAPAGAGGAP
jgi:2-polyprenyl-6-methoxyphenol hydroxylase-like FAD-dependent oxidoreductase